MAYNPNNPNGQATMANSQPVVLASDQASIPVTVSGVATAANQTTGNTSAASIDTKTPALGQALAAGSVPVVLTASQLSTLTPLSAVNATLSAETTKVIGVTRTADGTGNLINSIADGAGITGMAVAQSATNFVLSAAGANSTTTQLAASATFTGTIENVYNQQAISVLLTSDQNGTLTLNQYIDAAGLRKTNAYTYSIVAGTPFSRCFVANGNYFNLTFQNTGGSTTTTLNINTAYGTLPASTNKGNAPVSLDEVNGTAFSLGQTTMAASLPVTLASNQSSIPVTSSTTDVAPATQNITTQDLVSSTATGANSQSIITGTPTANSAASFAISSIEAIKVQVTGAWTGTLQSEVSLDGGTTWAINGIHQTGTAYTVATFTANFIGGLNVSGITNFRIRATAAMTGTATVKLVGTVNPNSIYVANGLNLQDATTQSQKLAISAAGAAKVDGSAVTQPVSGTVSSNAVDATATGTITTQNLVPAGTATANSAVEMAITGQGVGTVQITGVYTGALSLQYTVDGTNWVTNSLGTFVNTNTGAVTTTIASAAVGIFQFDAGGMTKVRITGLAAMTGTATVTLKASRSSGFVAIDTALPAGTNIIGALSANQSSNVAQINGVTPLMGNGVTGTGSQRVTLASDGTAISTAGYMSVKIDQTTSGTTNGMAPIAATAGGTSISSAVSAASNNKTQAKATAGQVYSISIQNISAAPVYLKMFDNTSAGVTAGTTACTYQFMCPANATAANGAGIVHEFPVGINHATGVTWMLTTGISTTDNTSTAANIAIVTIGYK